MSRIADKNTRIKHFEELIFLNHLCIDLKNALKVGGLVDLPYRGITQTRLEQFTRTISKLEKCKEQLRFK